MDDAVRVLLVDDEPVVRDVLRRYLTRDGFAVDAVGDGAAALASFRANPFDIVLLDLMLPELDGFEVFRQIRATESTPVIMLTGRGAPDQRIWGLELGADDYVVKPFSPGEVVARVRAVLRRGRPAAPAGIPISTGELALDPASRALTIAGRPVSLKPKEFDLLYFLAGHPGRVFTRLDLLERLWDQAFEGDASTVTVHMSRLRDKIEADPGRPRHLITVWGVGYRFDP